MKKNIALCLNDKYVDFCYVTMFSILENKNQLDDIVFHLLTDYFTDKNQKKFKALVSKSNDVVKIYKIDKTQFNGFNMDFSVYAWFRILIPEVVDQSVSKVLYLDCDTLVKTNIEYLFNLDINGNAIAGVVDPQSRTNTPFERLNYSKEKQYICSGVLLINVEYWRLHNITKKIFDYGKRHPEKCVYADQDAINYVCQDSKIMLPLKFGVLDNFLSEYHFYNKDEVLEAIESPEIIHYAGTAPWKYPLNYHLHRKTWWYYMRKSKLGYNTIRFCFFLSMINHYRRAVKYILTNFKAYPYRKPSATPKNDILLNLNK